VRSAEGALSLGNGIIARDEPDIPICIITSKRAATARAGQDETDDSLVSSMGLQWLGQALSFIR
jgi:hypothetical protein